MAISEYRKRYIIVGAIILAISIIIGVCLIIYSVSLCSKAKDATVIGIENNVVRVTSGTKQDDPVIYEIKNRFNKKLKIGETIKFIGNDEAKYILDFDSIEKAGYTIAFGMSVIYILGIVVLVLIESFGLAFKFDSTTLKYLLILFIIIVTIVLFTNNTIYFTIVAVFAPIITLIAYVLNLLFEKKHKK